MPIVAPQTIAWIDGQRVDGTVASQVRYEAVLNGWLVSLQNIEKIIVLKQSDPVHLCCPAKVECLLSPWGEGNARLIATGDRYTPDGDLVLIDIRFEDA